MKISLNLCLSKPPLDHWPGHWHIDDDTAVLCRHHIHLTTGQNIDIYNNTAVLWWHHTLQTITWAEFYRFYNLEYIFCTRLHNTFTSIQRGQEAGHLIHEFALPCTAKSNMWRLTCLKSQPRLAEKQPGHGITQPCPLHLFTYVCASDRILLVP